MTAPVHRPGRLNDSTPVSRDRPSNVLYVDSPLQNAVYVVDAFKVSETEPARRDAAKSQPFATSRPWVDLPRSDDDVRVDGTFWCFGAARGS